MFNRNTLLAALIAGASSIALPVYAQDATKEPAKPSTQSGPSVKAPTMQECHDRMAMKKSDKPGDKPMEAESDKACADMMKDPEASKTVKKPAKTGSQSGQMPAPPVAPMDSKTNNGK